ncbi:oxidoreductase 2OG-Fe(II) oxygenase family protein [Euphorbia peplus]|nr:oxidoreductase 2OG-Fe(II) oxygenase family protein [Euphorbia peplus]
MAMPPGNVVLSDKMQFPAGGVGVGNEIHQQHRPPQQWFHVDERDGFISWLRGEFAAANAMIDSLCHHLRAVGEPGEYDGAIGCIQQRRCNWNPVLHMQQYFSVGEVIFALQQVALRKQQQQQQNRYYNDQSKYGGKEYRRSSFTGFNKGYRGFGGEAVKAVYSSVENNSSDGNPSRNGETETSEEIKSGCDGGKLEDTNLALSENDKDTSAKLNGDSHFKSSGNSEGHLSDTLEAESETVGAQSSHKENDSNSSQNKDVKQNHTVTPKTFVASEIVDGKTVNVVDGLKLYENVLDDVEVSKIVSLVNDLRTAGRRGQFQGHTYVLSKRPMKGHGREMIQLGVPIVDAPLEDENPAATSKDRRSESIPTLLEDVIERFVGMQIMPVMPDSCIIDIYNEGDHSQPHMWPAWFGKPISVLFLTECDLTFGRVITADHPGDYKGSLKLPILPGSLLQMQGRSTDFSKHAIPAIRKQRILVTFTKHQPRKFDSQRLTSVATGSPSHWGPPPIRSPNHIRHSGPKHYSPIPTTGVLPAPANRPQIPAANGVQPLFATAPVGSPLPFPAPPVPLPPVSTGWPPAAPPRHPPNRLPVPVPGTGVFLPPSGAGNAAAPQIAAPAEMNFHVQTTFLPDKENGTGKPNSGNFDSPLDGKARKQNCNGIGNGSAVNEEHHQNVDHTEGNKSDGAV